MFNIQQPQGGLRLFQFPNLPLYRRSRSPISSEHSERSTRQHFSSESFPLYPRCLYAVKDQGRTKDEPRNSQTNNRSSTREIRTPNHQKVHFLNIMSLYPLSRRSQSKFLFLCPLPTGSPITLVALWGALKL